MTGNGDEMMQSMSLLDKGASFERQQLLFEQHGRAHGLLRSPSGSCVWVKAVLKYQEMMMCKCCRLHILSFSSSSFLLYWCSTLHCFPLLLRGRGRRCAVSISLMITCLPVTFLRHFYCDGARTSARARSLLASVLKAASL